MSNWNNSPPAYLYGLPSADTLRIDDLLDFSNHDLSSPPTHDAAQYQTQNQLQNVSVSGSSSDCYQHQSSSFPVDIYMPSEEVAELEWLSNFVEDSFSAVPYPSAPVTAAPQVKTEPISTPCVRKRSRGPIVTANSPSSSSSSSSSDFSRRRGSGDGDGDGGVRRCTHCASERTPQWRTGPLGPKTLCNACGVRFKSGRLVPEYRPAASPTFVLTQHSNSHRKVMELRRQKESYRHEVMYHDRVMSLS